MTSFPPGTSQCVSRSPNPRLLSEILFLHKWLCKPFLPRAPGLAAQKEVRSTSSCQACHLAGPVSSSLSPRGLNAKPACGSPALDGHPELQGGLRAGFQSPPRPEVELDMAKDVEDGRGIRSQTSLGLEIQHQPAGLGTTAIASNDPARVSVTVKTAHYSLQSH